MAVAPSLDPFLGLPAMFTTKDAYAAGVRRRDLAGPACRQLFQGAYVKVGAAPSLAEQASFALRVVAPAKFAVEHTATRLLGGIPPVASNLHLGATTRHQCTKPGIRLRYYAKTPDIVVIKGVPTTSAPQNFLDMARCTEFADLLVLGDSLVRATNCTPRDLRRFVADSAAHGSRHAREVAELIRDNVESPNESRLRLLMVSGGLPEPTINREIRTQWRSATRRLDLCYEEWKVAVEFDGRQHVERVQQWGDDILRREELEAMGWRFVVVTASEMYRRPLHVLQRIADAVALAGGPHIGLRGDWRRHFG